MRADEVCGTGHQLATSCAPGRLPPGWKHQSWLWIPRLTVSSRSWRVEDLRAAFPVTRMCALPAFSPKTRTAPAGHHTLGFGMLRNSRYVKAQAPCMSAP